MPGRVLVIAVLFAASIACVPTPAVDPEQPRPEDFVTTQKGTLPIVVSVPHGGRLLVPDVPERLGKGIANFATVQDSNTSELAEVFAAELEKKLKGKPWLVVARFDRKYLDVNRAPEEGYESVKAKPYYDAYHEALSAACKAIKTQFGRGLLLDLHGQAEYPDTICRGTQNGKTVTVLRDRFGWFAINGKRGLLGVLERGGYDIRPACTADEKAKEVPKFAGGYIVATYGSHTGYAIDAVQLEFGSTFRQKDRYAKTARDLADAVAIFHDEYLKDGK